jgi:hypothetical protein
LTAKNDNVTINALFAKAPSVQCRDPGRFEPMHRANQVLANQVLVRPLTTLPSGGLNPFGPAAVSSGAGGHEHTQFVARELDRWARVIKAAGIKGE